MVKSADAYPVPEGTGEDSVMVCWPKKKPLTALPGVSTRAWAAATGLPVCTALVNAVPPFASALCTLATGPTAASASAIGLGTESDPEVTSATPRNSVPLTVSVIGPKGVG